MITCVVEYVIDPAEIDAFERFGRRWIELVNTHGGTHHGYFLPAEGASDKALALFSFPSLAGYEQYRALFGVDPDQDQAAGGVQHQAFHDRQPAVGARALQPLQRLGTKAAQTDHDKAKQPHRHG